MRDVVSFPRAAWGGWTGPELAYHEQLSLPPALGVCMDAFRVGKPAKELLVCLACSPRERHYGVLPPQEHISHSTFPV